MFQLLANGDEEEKSYLRKIYDLIELVSLMLAVGVCLLWAFCPLIEVYIMMARS